MASPNIYSRVGGSSGARLAVRSPMSMSGITWYLGNQSGGLDGSSPQGKNRNYPLATLAQAYTNASAGDTIVCLERHAETLSSSQTIGKAGVAVVSEGTTATRASFTCSGASISMLSVTAARCTFDNLSFPVATSTGSGRLGVTGANVTISNCSFNCDGADTAAGGAISLGSGANSARVDNCTFTSTATAATARPAAALLVSAAISDLTLDTLVFDGGTYSWSDYAAKLNAAVTRLVAYDVDFLSDADLYLATGSIYKFHTRTSSGSSQQVFTA